MRVVPMNGLAVRFLEDFSAGLRVSYVPGAARGTAHRRVTGRVDGTTDTLGAAPSSRRISRKAAEQKGRRLQLMVRDHFLASGARVEMAQKKVLWIPDPRLGRRPISRVHDYFGLWDLVVVDGPRRFFVQVTTLQHVSYKRRGILESGFPATSDDLVLGQEKGRVYRVLRGPNFMTGEERLTLGKVKRQR